MHNREYFLHGVVPVLAASVLWALGYFARKMVLNDISPAVLTAITSWIATIFMLVVFRPNLRKLWGCFARHYLRFLSLALCGVVLATTLMFVGLDHLDLGVATLLEKLQPLFTALLATLFLREYFPAKLIPYCCLAVVFSYFIVNPQPWDFALKADWYGVCAVVGAAFFWAVAGVIGKSLVASGLTPPEISTIRFALASILMLPLISFGGVLHFKTSDSAFVWCIIIASAILSTGMGYLLYYKGMKHVDASTAAFLELITPVISLMLGLLFLYETLVFTQMLAIPGLLYVVYVIAATPRKRN